MWSGWRLTRKQLTSRPDHLWPELWESMGKHAKLKEKQKWSHEKPHLDNARKLRGIYFIDPDDKEFQETIKNARKKLETRVAPAMPCKIIQSNKNCGSVASNKIKTKLACILEASESTRLRMGESLPNHHDDHIAGKRDNSNTPAVLSLGKSFAIETDIPMNGSMVKNHISLKTGFEYNVILKTSYQSWFQACQRVRPPLLISQLQGHFQDRRGIVLHLLQARLRHRRQHQVIMRLENERPTLIKPVKTQKQIKKNHR